MYYTGTPRNFEKRESANRQAVAPPLWSAAGLLSIFSPHFYVVIPNERSARRDLLQSELVQAGAIV
jgi:hypothetical protein